MQLAPSTGKRDSVCHNWFWFLVEVVARNVSANQKVQQCQTKIITKLLLTQLTTVLIATLISETVYVNFLLWPVGKYT